MSGFLQQLADTLCHGFCGWNLQHDKRALVQLGSGRLEVDLVKRTCRFERDYIPRLAILNTLLAQFRHHLEANGMAPEGILSAILTIEITTEEREDQKDKSVLWFGEHDGFVGCELRICCTVSTADEGCKSEHSSYVEWPRKGG